MAAIFFRKILLVLLALPGISLAEDLSPGLWQITVQTRSDAVPNAAPAQVNQCLSAADAKDPSKLLGNIATPGASGCTYSDRRYSGNTFHFAMQCAGTFVIKATGDVSFTATSMSGTMSTSATVMGQPVDIKNQVSAQRIGDCSS